MEGSSEDRLGDIPPEEIRRLGHRVVDWIADYLAGVGELRVFPDVSPGDLRAVLPPHPPEQPESLDTALDDFERLVFPAVTHWSHPAFFAYFPSSGSGSGVLGEMLAAALNVNAMVWRSSPAGTELEEHVVDWLRQLVGLPGAFGGPSTTPRRSARSTRSRQHGRPRCPRRPARAFTGLRGDESMRRRRRTRRSPRPPSRWVSAGTGFVTSLPTTRLRFAPTRSRQPWPRTAPRASDRSRSWPRSVLPRRLWWIPWRPSLRSPRRREPGCM